MSSVGTKRKAGSRATHCPRSRNHSGQANERTVSGWALATRPSNLYGSIMTTVHYTLPSLLLLYKPRRRRYINIQLPAERTAREKNRFYILLSSSTVPSRSLHATACPGSCSARVRLRVRRPRVFIYFRGMIYAKYIYGDAIARRSLLSMASTYRAFFFSIFGPPDTGLLRPRFGARRRVPS